MATINSFRRATACLWAGAMLAELSCTGVVMSPGRSGTGGDGGPTGMTAPLCQAGAGPSPGPSYVRRLTRLEYSNTVRDLLGDTSGVADRFPAEELRLGFDNNAQALTVSPVLAEQYLLAAEAIATNAVEANWSRLLPCDPAGPAGADVCAKQFIATFGEGAYRRPLDADDTAALQAAFAAGAATDFKTGIRLVIETALQSPRFLYRVELGAAPVAPSVVKLDDWEMASRLSYLLWHTMPDAELIAAARGGLLSSPESIAAEARRMIMDPRAHAVVADFNAQWLHLGEIGAIEKDAKIFPKFSPAIAGLMREEIDRFLEDATWDPDGGDLATLFTAPYTFVNGALASYYGLTGVTGTAFVKTPVAGAFRGGLLTQGGLLSLLGKANQTSPVHRGKFVREQILCMELPPPPADLMIKPPDLSATLTTRQRFEQHAADGACSGCHHLMDPIGLGFEKFDGAGLYRDTENGQPVDDGGQLTESDVDGPFHGVLELGAKLASSGQVRSCMATKWFRYGYGRGETDADGCSLATIQARFAGGGYKVRDLLSALVETDAFLYRQVTLVGDAP